VVNCGEKGGNIRGEKGRGKTKFLRSAQIKNKKILQKVARRKSKKMMAKKKKEKGGGTTKDSTFCPLLRKGREKRNFHEYVLWGGKQEKEEGG